MKKFIEWIVKNNIKTIIFTAVVSLLLTINISRLKVIIDVNELLPQNHMYVKVDNLIEKIFGIKYTIAIGITAKQGTIFENNILSKVKNITDKLQNTPGIVRSNVLSLSSRKVKSISGNKDGMEVHQLMSKVPTTDEQIAQLKKDILENSVYENLVVSKDLKTAQILAEFKMTKNGMKEVEDGVREVIQPEKDDNVEITVSGLPVFLSLLEKYSERMGFLFPLAVLIIGLIHYEAFRSKQALILPLLTAFTAVGWATGSLALLGHSMDAFNAATPILILAIAAGHAVQILKRYYEEYAQIKKQNPSVDLKEANRLAVIQSLTKVGPVMVVACAVAALGFFSLIIFEVKSIRTFGVFTGIGIVSALFLELTFIPALRSLLPPPKEYEINREAQETIWVRAVNFLLKACQTKKKQIYLFFAVVVLFFGFGAQLIKVENSQKRYFYGKIEAKQDDAKLNERMGGTDTLYVLVDGGSVDSIKNPEVLNAMDKMQTFFLQEKDINKTVSIVDFVKKMNKSMNENKEDFFKVPDTRELISQYFLLYSNSGENTDFDSLVDMDYQKAIVQVFSHNDSSAYLNDLAQRAEAYALSIFPKDISVSIGGGAMGGVALNEVMIREKILNILQIIGVVFFLSTLVFRSFVAGFLIIIPVGLAVIVNFGVMGLLGIPLQIATALVSAMAVGIGADYGIYMSYRLKEELASGKNEEEAIKKGFHSAGKATLFVSSAVAGGFGVLILSWGFLVHLWMGSLISLAMVVSAFTALTLFPALVFTIRPKFIFANKKIMTLFIIVGLSFSFNQSAKSEGLSAFDVMKKNFITTKVADSQSDTIFKLKGENSQERIRETVSMTKLADNKGNNMRVITFNSPSDVKGTKTLLVEKSPEDDDIWIYLPALKKVRRIVASNKKDSFMGTDLSFGDIIGYRLNDWNHKILKEEDKVDGKSCFVIESLPKNSEVSENSGYSKRIGWFDKESFVLVKGEVYDLSKQLLKKIYGKNIQKVDQKNNRWQPMLIEAENVQTKHKTTIEFKNYKANVGVDPNVFTTRYLEKL